MRHATPPPAPHFGPMKIAVALEAPDRTGHFGRAEIFRIYRVGPTRSTRIEDRPAIPICGGPRGDTLERDDPFGAFSDCRAVVVAAIGPCGLQRLEATGIPVLHFEGPAEQAAAFAFQALSLPYRSFHESGNCLLTPLAMFPIRWRMRPRISRDLEPPRGGQAEPANPAPRERHDRRA